MRYSEFMYPCQRCFDHGVRDFVVLRSPSFLVCFGGAMVQLRFASLPRGVADFCCAQRRPSPPPEQHLAKVLTAKARREPSQRL